MKHPVPVVPIALLPHPNADSLSIVRVGGFQAIVRTQDWIDRPLGAYVPPDSIVPEALAPAPGATRVRAIRLRGEWSEGLLVPAPEGSSVGDDVGDLLGILHYEPTPEGQGGEERGDAPPCAAPSYDLDNARRFSDSRWSCGETLIITEKIHGASWRAVVVDGRLYVGSRSEWKVERCRGKLTLPWRALTYHPEIVQWLADHEGTVLYGEAYGNVGRFPYDVPPGEVRIRLFDRFQDGRFMDWYGVHGLYEDGLPVVPEMGRVEWGGDLSALNVWAEGRTTIGQHIREGAVIRPLFEAAGDRAVLKLVGRGYLAKS